MQFFLNKVVFLRHGETEWNVQDRMQGQSNSKLTEVGISQAQAAAGKLASQKYDIIVSSPLSRALETAKILAERLNISEMVTDAYLMERNLGVLQGLTVEETKSKFPYLWDSDGKFIADATIPNAESLEEFLHRISMGLEKLQETSRAKSVLVVTHDGVLHALISHIKMIRFADVGKLYKFKHCDPIMLIGRNKQLRHFYNSEKRSFQ